MKGNYCIEAHECRLCLCSFFQMECQVLRHYPFIAVIPVLRHPGPFQHSCYIGREPYEGSIQGTVLPTEREAQSVQ
jgi:hypothetical protein